jgi:AcrR family transcriptional regulator
MGVSNTGQEPARAAVGNGSVRDRLARAAVELFDRKGYAATSVREIVAAAGVTKPALYYHFGSKEGLFLAIMRRAVEALTSSLSASRAGPGSVRDRIKALAQDVHELFRENVGVVRLVHVAIYGPPGEMPPFDARSLAQPLTAAIDELVREGIGSGELREAPVEDAVRTVEGVVHACLQAELAQLGPAPGAGGMARALDVVFDGLAAVGGKECVS